MKKKLALMMAVVLLVLPVIASASLVDTAVRKLFLPAVYKGAAGAVVASTVKSTTTSGAIATEVVALALPTTALVGLAAIVAATSYGVDYIFQNAPSWMNDNKYKHTGAGTDITQDKTYSVPMDSPTANGDYTGVHTNPNNGFPIREIWHGLYPNFSAAVAAAGGNRPHIAPYGMTLPPSIDVLMLQTTGSGEFSFIREFWFYVKDSANTPMKDVTETTQVTSDQVSDKLKADLDADVASAKDVIEASLQAAEQGLENPNSPLAPTTPAGKQIQDTLKSNLSTDQTTKIETNATPTDDTWAKTQTSSLSAQEVKNAVKAALDDETGVTQPTDPTITNPTKKSLTTVLNTFMNEINSLPIVNTLNGITVTCSGTSVLCLNLPDKYGGVRCWDAAPISSDLNMIGTAILSMTTIMSFIYIFKS